MLLSTIKSALSSPDSGTETLKGAVVSSLTIFPFKVKRTDEPVGLLAIVAVTKFGARVVAVLARVIVGSLSFNSKLKVACDRTVTGTVDWLISSTSID